MKCLVTGLLIFLSFFGSAENSVTITIKDKSVNLWLNIFYSPHQLESELYRIGNMYKVSTLNIKCDSAIIITTGIFNKFHFDYTFQCGDSVVITQGENGLPYFRIINRLFNETELNYDYLQMHYATKKNRQPSSAREILNIKNKSAFLLDSLFAEGHISEKFYQHRMLMLPAIANNSTITINRMKSGKIPLDSLLEVPLFEDSLTRFKEYNSYLSNYVRSVRVSSSKKFPPSSQCFDYVLNNINGRSRDQLLYIFLKGIYFEEEGSMPSYFEKFKSVVTDPDLLYPFETILGKPGEQEEFIATSMKNPGMLRSADSNELKNFSDILRQHPGKVIYIDFWASWCMPCRAHMPDSKKLKETMKGEDFVIIYISLDQKQASWNKACKEFKLTDGNSFILLDPPTAGLLKTYKVSSIPYYMLIDKEGKIVKIDAPAPGDKKLLPLIRNLLAKSLPMN